MTLRVSSSCLEYRDDDALLVTATIKARSAYVILINDRRAQLAATTVRTCIPQHVLSTVHTAACQFEGLFPLWLRVALCGYRSPRNVTRSRNEYGLTS